MRLSGKRVFLSGPMSVGHWNVDGFAIAHEKVKESGAAQVYNPAIEYLQSGSAKDSHQECMRRTLAELTREREFPEGFINTHVPNYYDAIVMLPGWERSVGAKLEMDVATACGIEVVMLQDVEPYDEKSISAKEPFSFAIPDGWSNVTASHDCVSAKDASHDCNMAKE